MRFPPRPNAIRALLLLTVLMVLVAACARLLHLEADFPVELTKSAAPLSDEGWHSNAAARYWQFGYWYLPGDVNRAITQPVFHLLQWITFSAMGVSLFSARLTAVLLFLGLVGVMTSTIRLQAGLIGALLTTLLLTTNFHLFAYSRIALVDLPMLFFVIASLGLLVSLRSQRAFLGGALAGLVYSWALLTKPSALFAMPVLLLVAAIGIESSRFRVRRSLGFLTSSVLSTGSHYLLGLYFFPQDMPEFWFLIASKVRSGGPGRWERTWSAIRIMGGREPLLCVALVVSVLVIAHHWRKTGLRSQRVTIFYLLGAVGYFAVISSSHYQPVRYFVPFIVLAIGVVALATAIAISEQRRPVAAVLLILVGAHIAVGTFRIADYLSHPEWSYRDFCEQLVSDLEGTTPPVLLMGDMAPQVSMATGIEAISGQVGTESAAWRYQTYQPTHLITRGPISSQLRAAVPATDDLELIKTYDVMHNHYNGAVHLYRVVRPTE